ncbi:MAG: hypothetical protein HQK62_04980 [Desulfamplus sp.]|nr:hypothetical protein [Desulfamplus sp.]MBF0258183.1 hypothetical protein [Desulfamplus sp.]
MLRYIIELIPTSGDSVTLSSSEWSIIVMLNKYPDFNKLIAELKKNYNMTIDDIKASLVNLQKRKILKLFQTEVSEESSETGHESTEKLSVTPETPALFWEKLENELSRAIGPIAAIVIDDAVSEFHITREKFPGKFLYSLVEKVAAEIHAHAEKTQFQKAMLEVIKQSL